MSMTLRSAASSFFGMPPIFRRREAEPRTKRRGEILDAKRSMALPEGAVSAAAPTAPSSALRGAPRFELVEKVEEDDYSDAFDRELGSRLR